MKFLADAHISRSMVAMMRELGHDCLDSAAIPPRMPDIDVLRMAASDERVVVTSDKDFGELVFVHGIACRCRRERALCSSALRWPTKKTGLLTFGAFGRRCSRASPARS